MAERSETGGEFEFPDEAIDDTTELRIDGWSPPPPRRVERGPSQRWPILAAVLAGGMALSSALLRAGHRGRALLALGLGIGAAAALWRRGPLFEFRYDIPQLNDPPVERPTVPVEGHGEVHVGRTDVPQEGGGNRPYLWLWMVPAADNECGGSYRWYQFVRPRLFIDERAKRSRAGFTAATGLEYHLDEWNPDYHVSETGPADPAFSPGDLGLDAGRAGKPFRHYDVPGTRTGGGTSRLTGVLDAPNFCVRSADGQSQAERFLGRFIKPHEREAEQPQAPPNREVQVRIEVQGRSYLVCIRDGQAHCIGYVSWTYVNDVGVRLVWREAGIAGGTNRKWKLGSTLTRCASSLTIGDWTRPC